MFSKYNFKVIRTIRRRAGLTMEQLAQKSGVTYPTVAAVETNKSLPSMKTLDAISGALQFSASNMLALAERRVVQIRRAEAIEGGRKNQLGIENLKVANFDKGKMIRTEAKEGERIHVMDLHEDCHEMAYILSGEVSLRVDDNNYILRQDDTILFDGVLDHEYEVLKDSEFLTIHIPKDLRSIKDLLDNKQNDIAKQTKIS